MTDLTQQEATPAQSRMIHLPSPTAWPLLLAFGAMLMFAGLVTHLSITVAGVLLALASSVGWFRQVLPHEQHTEVVETTRRSIDRLYVGQAHRANLPLETYPVHAGIKGGIAGGIAMVIPAL